MIKKFLIFILFFLSLLFTQESFAFYDNDQKVIDSILEEQKTLENTQNNNNEILQQKMNDLRSFVLEVENRVSSKVLEHSNQALSYSKDTITFFMIVLGVITAFGAWFSWSTVRDMKKSTKEIANKIAKKEIGKQMELTKKSIKEFEELMNKNSRKQKEIEIISDLEREASRTESSKRKIDIYNKILKKRPKSYITYINKGIVLNSIRNYKKAIECFNKAIKIRPKDTLAFYNKGVVLLEIKDYKKAIKCFDKAINIDPLHVSAYRFKAISFVELGDNNKAIKYFNKAIEIEPCNYEVICGKAYVLLNLNKFEDAIDLFEKAWKYEKEAKESCDNLSYAINISYAHHKLKNFKKAYDIASGWLCLVNDSLELIVNKGLSAAALQRREEAKKLLDIAKQIAPQDQYEEILYCRARMFALIQDFDGALRLLKKLVDKKKSWIEEVKNNPDFETMYDFEEFIDMIRG